MVSVDLLDLFPILAITHIFSSLAKIRPHSIVYLCSSRHSDLTFAPFHFNFLSASHFFRSPFIPFSFEQERSFDPGSCVFSIMHFIIGSPFYPSILVHTYALSPATFLLRPTLQPTSSVKLPCNYLVHYSLILLINTHNLDENCSSV